MPVRNEAPVMGRAALIEQVMPAVVNVSTVVLSQAPTKRSASDASSRDPNSFSSTHGFGSGLVIDSNGLIVTNRHVVENAVRITVTFQDQTTLPARIVGRLSTADVALLEVTPAKALPALQWGDSDKLRLGDEVVAIGNPLGLGGSVSAGIVSGLNRDIRTTPFDDFIQTDAAINHGNSGGPLFDMRGRVVGINTAIFSPSDTSGSIGISFALPSEIAAFIVDETRRYGRVRAGSIDIRTQTVTPDIADAIGARDARGAIILGIDRNGSAATAGLRRGDVITEVGAAKLAESRALLRMIAVSPLDRPVSVKVSRQGQELVFHPIVHLFREPSPSTAAQLAAARQAAANSPDAGLQMAEITAALRARYKLKADTEGVLVTGVAAYSPADMRGIVAGDVVVEAGQQRMMAPAEVSARIAEARRQDLRYMLFLITGPGGDRFVTLPMHPGFQEQAQSLEGERRQ